MPRHFPHAVCTTLAIVVGAFLLSAAALVAAGQAQAAADQSLVGRLAFVEPSLKRISVVPEGEIYLADLLVPEGTEVRQGERELTLSDLVIQVGRRVTVRYRVEGDRRIAQGIMVEPE